MNAPCNYRYPLYVLTDADYNAAGAIAWDPHAARYVGHDTTGATFCNRKTGRDAMRAAVQRGYCVVSSAWYGVTDGRPCDDNG